jgi:hypothetical protein
MLPNANFILQSNYNCLSELKAQYQSDKDDKELADRINNLSRKIVHMHVEFGIPFK